MKDFFKRILWGASVFSCVIVFAGILNGCVVGLESFYAWVAAFNLVAMSYWAYIVYKNTLK